MQRCLQPGSESHVVSGISLLHEVGSEDLSGSGLSFSKCSLAARRALLFIRPVSPAHDLIQNLHLVLAEQDTQVNHLDLPGVLSSCPSKSE